MSKEIQRNNEIVATSPNGRGKNFLMLESELRSSGEGVSRRANAFTLAEIMVVLFIMTIILAAFAPLMTVRVKSTSRTSPWNWATPDSANTYFGVHPNQRVMIGQKTKGEDIDNKLTINTRSANQAHILFKRNDSVLGQLWFNSASNIWLGNSLVQNNFVSGWGNMGIGSSALANINSGDGNVALGLYALANMTAASRNTAIGTSVLQSASTSSSNTGIGFYSLIQTTGSSNTAVGDAALYYNTTGSGNTGVGRWACEGLSKTANYTTCLGYYSGPNASVSTANTVYLGNAYSTVKVLAYLEAASSNISSDVRLKNIQGDYTSGLEQIKKIKPVKFTFKDDKKKTPRVGVIAQDLQKIFPKAVMKGDDGFLKIRQEDMFYAMINAIKDLAHRDDAKGKKIKELESRIEQLEKLVK